MYSQEDEEVYILDCLKDLPAGRFLDIGAWNAVDKSNTCALYNLGWSGVMIEPSPGPMRNLLDTCGSRTQLVSAAACVNGDKLASFYVTDDAVSTTESSEYAKWRNTATFLGTLIVPTISMAQIFENFGSFDFVSIDTEGTSVDLFKEMLRLRQKPQCICVEFNDRKDEAINAAVGHGYVLAHATSGNLIFRRDS